MEFKDSSNNNIEAESPDLIRFASKLDESSREVSQNLSKFRGRSFKWIRSNRKKKMENLVARHIEMHKELQKTVHELEAKGKTSQVPLPVISALNESKEVIRQLSTQVGYSTFLKAVLPEPEIVQPKENFIPYSDPNKLLTPINPDTSQSRSNMKEWELNFGLLHSAYQRTNNEETKSTIRFLMTNYLQKAAYLNSFTGIDVPKEDGERYRNMLQLGQMTKGGMYHRTANTMAPTMSALNLEEKVGATIEKAGGLVATDTIDIQELYSVSFVPILDISNAESASNTLVENFEAHLDKFPGENMEFPFLMDITAQIGQSLITDDDPEKIEEYLSKQLAAKTQINEIIQIAAEKLKKKYPDNDEIQKKAHDFIKTNTGVVSRAQVTKHVGVINLYVRMFDDSDFESKSSKISQSPYVLRNKFIKDKIKLWAVYSAVCVGAVNFRQASAESFSDPTDLAILGQGRAVNYNVPGKTDVTIYEKPSSLLESNVFTMLTKMTENKKEGDSEGKVVMVNATVQMMRTLLNSISEENWSSKQEDPVIKELTQTALLRTSQHLAAAINSSGNFRQFIQAIDRTHSELTTLLALYHPFDINSFDTSYREFIQPLFPESMEPTQVGVARSAMNVFAGVNAAVIKGNPNPVRICGEHSYYEESILVGGNQTLEKALADPKIEKIDMYVAEFYHNIDIDPNHTNYQKGTVIQDIKRIFAEKPKTDSLTIALDATIDLTKSEDVKELLEEFKKEIKDGKLNIVAFRSGQKFDMIGLDNYFGSTFYIVNNGDDKWSEFNKIKTEAAFQTDEISQQFFAWMAKTGPEIMDQYKSQIFKNTEEILRQIPEGLKPSTEKDVCMATFEEGVKTPFIDVNIKFTSVAKQEKLRRWAQKHFIKLFSDEDKLVYVRGSFGFPHPNFTWIEPKIRINPGVDPDELPLYKQFFEDFEKKAKEIEAENL